jgi:hypothetical protein
MQISILSGVYSSGVDFRTSYPVNLAPVAKSIGLSAGYLRPAEGIALFATSPGKCRGGVNWRDEAYFVCGDKLIKVNAEGKTTTIDMIADDGKPVRFSFSFDRLGIASDGKLYYLKNNILTQVTDSDLGTANDVKYLDGYFLTTDGDFIVQTSIVDPTNVSPYTYGSSEVDPDPIEALIVNRNELFAINRYTIEVFTNSTVAGSVVEYFAFARIDGAHIQKGAVGRDAVCVYNEALAFVGSGRNEAPAVYLGENAQTVKLSTREIDQILAEYTEQELSTVIAEARTDKGHKLLYIHLPDKTLVYDSAATIALQEPIWYILTSSLVGDSRYLGCHFVWAYNRWLVGDPTSGRIGVLSDTDANHYGQIVRTEFGTAINWAETGGAVVHAMELQALNPSKNGKQKMSASYTTDGVTWSQDRWATEYQRRLVWPQQGLMHGWRAYRFRGTSDAMLSFSRLDGKVEPLVL